MNAIPFVVVVLVKVTLDVLEALNVEDKSVKYVELSLRLALNLFEIYFGAVQLRCTLLYKKI